MAFRSAGWWTRCAAATARWAAACSSLAAPSTWCADAAMPNRCADFENIVLTASETGTPIRVKDVGQVVLGPDLRRGVSDLDGNGEVVSGIVIMRQGENALQVIDRVKAKLHEIEPGLPPGVEVVPIYDRSDLIRRSISNLRSHAHRSALHCRAGGAAVSVARSQRHHPADHHSRCRPARVHSLPHAGDDREYHVAGRHRHCHWRAGGCLHCGGGADAQEAGRVGARRTSAKIIAT